MLASRSPTFPTPPDFMPGDIFTLMTLKSSSQLRFASLASASAMARTLAPFITEPLSPLTIWRTVPCGMVATIKNLSGMAIVISFGQFRSCLSEINFIVGFDGQHHLHHPASSLLLRFVIAFPNPLCESRLWIFALLDMAEIALHAERSSDKIHHEKKLRVRQTFEHLNVLARLFDGLFALRSLRSWERI